jgi:hypothetical protein
MAFRRRPGPRVPVAAEPLPADRAGVGGREARSWRNARWQTPCIYSSPRLDAGVREGMSEPQWGALYLARRRGDVPAQLGLRAHVVYRVLARRYPAAPGVVRRRALKIYEIRACRRRRAGGRKSAGLGMYQVGLPLLCAGERPGPLGGSIQRKAEGTGEAVAADKPVLKHHQVEAGLPAVPRNRVREPAGQASVSVSAGSALGPLSFRRIVDVPFEACVAALDSWQRPGLGGELRFGGSHLAGPMEHDRDSGTRRIEVRLARGPLRPRVRMRLDIDRWSSSSTALELIPCGRVRPTAAYFRAGHLLLDSLTRFLPLHLPRAHAPDTASQPPVPAGSRRP